MKKIAFLLLLALSGCASHKYTCTAGEEIYYAEDYSAIVVTEEKVLVGACL